MVHCKIVSGHLSGKLRKPPKRPVPDTYQYTLLKKAKIHKHVNSAETYV
jgi:hypothetical protein